MSKSKSPQGDGDFTKGVDDKLSSNLWPSHGVHWVGCTVSKKSSLSYIWNSTSSCSSWSCTGVHFCTPFCLPLLSCWPTLFPETSLGLVEVLVLSICTAHHNPWGASTSWQNTSFPFCTTGPDSNHSQHPMNENNYQYPVPLQPTHPTA